MFPRRLFFPNPFVLFFLFTFCSVAKANFSLFSQDGSRSSINPNQTLLIVVAPFNTNEKVGFFKKDPGREIQHKIALELKADRRLRVVETDRPVSEGPDHDLEAGFSDANRLLAQTGADLIIWGNKSEDKMLGEWNIYVSAAGHVQNKVREEGFSLEGTAYFTGIQETDTLELLGWAVGSWKGLIDHSYGMDITDQIKPMIEKTDQTLSLAYEKQWSGQTRLEMEKYLSVLLCLYANKTQDPKVLDRAVSVTSLLLESTPRVEEGYNWACWQNNLGGVLQTRGMMRQSSEDLEKGVQAFRAALHTMSEAMPGSDVTDIQLNLAECLEILGRREGNTGHLEEARKDYSSILSKTSKDGQTSQWIDAQLGLANTYYDLGIRQTNLDDLRRSIRHYKAVLGLPNLAGMPIEQVHVETNLGSVYGALGGRTQNPGDYREALGYLDKAIAQMRGLSSTHNLAIGLLNKGTCLMNLGRIENREDEWAGARQTYQEAASLFGLSNDRMEWASIQRDMGNLELFSSEKRVDPQDLQKAVEYYDQEQTVHARKTMPLLWAQASVMKGLVLGLEGDSVCNPNLISLAQQTLEEAGKEMNSPEQAFALLEKNQALAAILQMEGEENHDPVKLRTAVAMDEKTLEDTKDTQLEARERALQSDLCRDYALLLLLDPDDGTAEKAVTFLKNLGSSYDKAPAAVDRFLHRANKVELEGILALRTKDEDGLAQALERYEKAVEGLQQEGYIYYAARKEIIMGDMEVALARLKGDKLLLRKAVLEYAKARPVLERKSVRWKKALDEKTAKALGN